MKTYNLTPWTTAKAIFVGDRYGRYTVVALFKQVGSYAKLAEVRCDCGSENRFVHVGGLRNGEIQSCGCLHKERVTKHGAWGAPLFPVWKALMSRCYNESDKRYNRYGGRGITVCQEWQDVGNFIADMTQGYSKGLTIDRIDNDAGYSKGNCRWATRAEQNRNYSRNIVLTHEGKTMCLADWAVHLDITYGTLWDRIDRGWTTERTLSTPVKR